MRISFLIIIAIACFSTVDASITLEYAESLALENNETLQAFKHTTEQGHQDYLQTHSQWYPSATLSNRYTKTEHPNAYGENTAHTTGVSLGQEIFNTDLYYLAKNGGHAYDILRLDLSSLANDIIYQVRSTYYMIVLLQEQVHVYEENIKHLLDAQRQEKHKFELGESTNFDLNQSTVAVANALTPYYEATKELKVAKNTLSRLLVTEDTVITETTIPILQVREIAEKLTILQLLTENEQGASFIDRFILHNLGDIDQEVNLPLFTDDEILQWESIATTQKPSIKKEKLSLEIAYSTTKQHQCKYLPNLKAFGNYTHSSATTGYGVSSYWDAGVLLSWQLFDGFGRERSIKGASEGEHAARIKYEKTIEEAKIDVRNSFHKIESALLSYSAADKSVGLAEQAMEQAKERIEVGEITPMEYRDTAKSLTEARYNKNKANYDLLISYYSLRHTTGIDTRE